MPRDGLPTALEWVSDVLPLSYAVDAMKAITTQAAAGADVAQDVGIIAAFVVVLVGLGAATLRRRTD